MLRMTAKCPRYNEALEEVLQLPQVRKELEENQLLFKELSAITGLNVSSAADITSIFITLLAEVIIMLFIKSCFKVIAKNS